jgi:Rho-binding antiterminator
MSFKSHPYKPISCSFHDELEALAVQQRIIEIVFLDDTSKRQALTSQIVDFKTREGVEFMVLRDGQIFCLDKIISVDGKSLPDENNPYY